MTVNSRSIEIILEIPEDTISDIDGTNTATEEIIIIDEMNFETESDQLSDDFFDFENNCKNAPWRGLDMRC